MTSAYLLSRRLHISGIQTAKMTRAGALGGLLLLASIIRLVGSASGAFCEPTSSDCWPAKNPLARWIASLSNGTTVLLPNEDQEDQFLSASTAMNLLKSSFPAIIVIPGTEADLRSAVVFASQHRIRVVARCSGHDFNGRSSGRNVMLIKTERLNSVSYNSQAQTVTFHSGANHGDIYEALVPHNRMYVGGQSKTVCPAGCLAGGCHGLLSRQFGLAADSITRIRMVLFNGTTVVANRTVNSDLFHAYLGAGQNSFGIALSFTARTHPAPPFIIEINMIMNLTHPNNTNGPNAFTTFFMNTTWWRSTPLALSGNINLNDGLLFLKLFYSGTNYAAANATLLPLIYSPFFLHVDPLKYHANMYDLAIDNYPPVSEMWQRKFLTNAFLQPNQPTLNAVADVLVQAKPYMWLWFLFGGAVRNGTTGVMSNGMRTAMYEALFGAQWFDPNQDQGVMDMIQQYLPTLYSVATTSYNNEYTTWGGQYNVLPDWKTRFYRDYGDLLKVKRKYDPCNLFTAMYGPGWDRPSATCGAQRRAKHK